MNETDYDNDETMFFRTRNYLRNIEIFGKNSKFISVYGADMVWTYE